MASQNVGDLVALVADADIEQTLHGLLAKGHRLGIRHISSQIVRHTDHDPGCRVRSVPLLRPYLSSFRRALVVFDRDGCGSEASREQIQRDVEEDLGRNGWRGRARAIVIEPEVEAWFWNGSSRVAEELGWAGDYRRLRAHLAAKDFWPTGTPKPPDPKRALREAMRAAPLRRKARQSPAKFRRLAAGLPPEVLGRCVDPAFLELADTLRRWFPPEGGEAGRAGQPFR